MKKYLPIFLLVILSIWLIFPKLGETPLRSWDEAWYGEISRNIVKNNNWFLMQWNGLPYYDHPPIGFWLMALSFKIFSVSEFSTRFPSAICGLFSVLLIFLIGKKLFNSAVGLGAGIILSTIPWFWLRSREGNMDIILLFFILLSLFLTLKFKESKKTIYFFLISISFPLLLLTKTIIGIGILPTIIFILLPEIKQVKLKTWFIFFIIMAATLIPWYLINYLKFGASFLERNIFVTGLRLASSHNIGDKMETLKFYFSHNLNEIRNGISLWYKPFLISFLGSIIFLKKKSFQILYLWLVIYFLIFFTSEQTELWHYIIVYPAIALLVSAFLHDECASLILKRFSSIIKLSSVATLIIILFFSFRIVKGLRHDIIKSQPINDEIILSKEAGKYNDIFYIDDDYWPTAVFYSEKKVFSIVHSTDTKIKTIPLAFEKSPRPFLLLTQKWILGRDDINPKSYEVLKQIGDRILIRVY